MSGDKAALDAVMKGAIDAGALKAAPLAVSGAFHTTRMEPAARGLAAALSAATLRPPRIPVVSNVTGRPFPADPAEIASLLAAQLTQPVLWEQSVRWLLSAGRGQLHEVGPGVQIKAMVKRIDPEAWRTFKNTAC